MDSLLRQLDLRKGISQKDKDNYFNGCLNVEEKHASEIRLDFLTADKSIQLARIPMQQLLITRPIQRPMKLRNILWRINQDLDRIMPLAEVTPLVL